MKNIFIILLICLYGCLAPKEENLTLKSSQPNSESSSNNESDSANGDTPAVEQVDINDLTFNALSGYTGSYLMIEAYVDHNDYVYISNYSGLEVSKDAGNTFTKYSTANGLLTNYIFATRVTQDNTIYSVIFDAPGLHSPFAISTDNGENFVEYGGGVIQGEGRSLFIDPVNENNIYIGTGYGINYSSNGGVSSVRLTTSGLGGYDIFSIQVTSDGTIYAATLGGLSILEPGQSAFTNYTTSDGLPHNGVRDLYVSETGKIYLATDGGFSMKEPGGSFVNKTTADGIGHLSTSSVLVKDGVIYLGTDDGLSISTDDGETFTNYRMPKPENYLPNVKVESVAIDSYGRIFVATDYVPYIGQ